MNQIFNSINVDEERNQIFKSINFKEGKESNSEESGRLKATDLENNRFRSAPFAG